MTKGLALASQLDPTKLNAAAVVGKAAEEVTDEDLHAVLKARFDKGDSSAIILLRLEQCKKVAVLPREVGNWLLSLQELWAEGAGLTGEYCVAPAYVQHVAPILRPTSLTCLPAALPDSIGQLQALEGLYLRGNQLAGEH